MYKAFLFFKKLSIITSFRNNKTVSIFNKNMRQDWVGSLTEIITLILVLYNIFYIVFRLIILFGCFGFCCRGNLFKELKCFNHYCNTNWITLYLYFDKVYNYFFKHTYLLYFINNNENMFTCNMISFGYMLINITINIINVAYTHKAKIDT